MTARPALTEAGAADEGGGGESAGGGTIDLPGVGDEEGGMLLQAAGYPDVVDPQEAAAGEGDIPGGVQGEHGALRGTGTRRPRGSPHATPPLGGRLGRRQPGSATDRARPALPLGDGGSC